MIPFDMVGTPVAVIGARKFLFAWEILASDIYLGCVRFTPEECPSFQVPERYNLFDGGVVVDLAWHGGLSIMRVSMN
jgi:hypothetical protein